MVQASDAVWLPVLPSMQGFGPALAKGAGAEADKAGKSTGMRFGKALAIGVVAAGAGLGAAAAGLYKVGEVFDDVADTIRVGTGATGKQLDGLVDSAKRVGSQVPAEFSAVGTTIADLNTRMGLTGGTLETVAKQYLEAGRILGEDVDIQATSAAFNSFGIEGEAVVGAMDHLFQVSQATGIGMNELAGTVSKNAPALQTLGFSFDEAAVMVGSFDKAGLNSQAVMASMSKGLVTLAKDGEQPKQAFERVVGQIQGYIEKGDEAGALNLASKVFGTRGATQFIGALKNGTVNLDDMTKAAGQTGDTILEAGEDTADFAESWQLFKNNVLVWLEPMAATVFGALGTAMGSVVEGANIFGNTWAGNASKVTGSGMAAYVVRFAEAAKAAFNYVRDVAIPNLIRFGGWVVENRGWIAGIATVIGAILLPALVRMGVAHVVQGAKAVGAWVATQGAAVKAGVTYVAQSIRIIGTWVAMAGAAIASGAQTVAIWAMYKAEAVKAAGVYVAQKARIVGAWVAMSAAAVVSGARTAAVWVGTVIASAARGAAAMAAHAARVVASWSLMAARAAVQGAKQAAVWTVTVIAAAARGSAAMAAHAAKVAGRWLFMGAQALLHAARMAGAWLVAMGPIGWAIAAIVGIAAIVIANWDKIKRWTVDTWNRVSGKIREVWERIIRPVFQALGTFIRDKVQPVFGRAVDAIVGAWRGIANAARKPVNFVIGTVYNNGIRKAYNAVAKVVGLGQLGAAREIPAFAKGGKMPRGWKLVGEEGPELINTAPGYVYTAEETKRLLSSGRGPDLSPAQAKAAAGNSPAEAQAPMGGWWEDVKNGAKWVADNTVGKAVEWTRGRLADSAEAVLRPVWGALSANLPSSGWGGIAKGIGGKALDGILKFIRGKDEEAGGGSTGAVFDGAPGGFHRPSRGPITSWFGPRWGRRHDGIDFGGSGPAYAMWDGLVQKIGWNLLTGRTGIGVLLSHGKGLQSYYGHNPSFGAIPVRVGQRVKGGQPVGRGGSTGNATGDHTHAEVLRNGRAQNFAAMLRDTGGSVPPGWNAVFNGTPHDELMLNHRDALRTAEALRGVGNGLPSEVTLVVQDGPTLKAYVASVGDARLAEHVGGLRQVARQVTGTR